MLFVCWLRLFIVLSAVWQARRPAKLRVNSCGLIKNMKNNI